MPPTPVNYLAIYQEISGADVDDSFQERPFKVILGALPRSSPEQLRLARQLDDAVTAKSWAAIGNAINDLVAKAGGAPLHWSGLIRNLLNQLDSRASGLTTAKKREALDHVLNSSSNPDLLFQRLQSLTRNWARAPAGGDVVMVDADIPDALADLPSPIQVVVVAAAQSPKTDADFREISALLLQNTIVSMLIEAPQLADECVVFKLRLAAQQGLEIGVDHQQATGQARLFPHPEHPRRQGVDRVIAHEPQAAPQP